MTIAIEALAIIMLTASCMGSLDNTTLTGEV